MPDLLVRDVKPETVELFKVRARRRGHSLQAELWELIETAASRERTAEAEFWASVWAFRDSLKGRPHSDSGELIREDRDER
ncbi:MAG: FitA-like ribbon-helix-helix domain-containing protein [Dehalococcoidia bacterium]